MELIEVNFIPKWTAKLVAHWGDKQWKVFRNGESVGMIGSALARTAEEAIIITKNTLKWSAPTRR